MPVPLVSLCIASFTGDRSRGNLHQVEVFEGELPPNPKPLATPILVEISLASARVRFSLDGRCILRCGSGTIAAAQALSQLDLLPYQLQATDQTLALAVSPEGLTYTAESLALSPSDALGRVRSIFDHPPVALCTSGGPGDYLIAEFACSEQVRQLRPDPARICATTNRAVIATAASDVRGFDYVLRYFAPQYGVMEDSATGSANIMAAHYWQNRLQQRRVAGLQLSKAGGECWVKSEPWRDALVPRVQTLGARAQVIDS